MTPEQGPKQVEVSLVNQIPGKRHDDFRRQRNACRFNSHQRNNSGITAGVDDMGYEFNQEGDKFFVHLRTQYISL